MSAPFVGVQCWQPERISAVINKEALAVERANFLATHMPMRRIIYERTPRQLPHTSEHGFLEELNAQAAADRHVFAVIKGIPGTGKSHLIRWLKEQYALAHPDETVLLVSRANSSLRSTLEQIVSSQIFDADALPAPLQRLRDAVEVLSQDTLDEQLLNSLHMATRTLDTVETEQQLGRLRHITPEKVESFLLDKQVRTFLKLPKGPIERIVTFLTRGARDNFGLEQIPGFEADDFKLGTDRLRTMRNLGGYDVVVKLCEDLQSRSEIRDGLARYLNYALNRFAVQNATQLAAGDLRSMFGELRRHLRATGRSLALFIEDITAFTGIDQGLVEVLVTQHAGEANAEFCRLTSAIGITDAWFADNLPLNIQERVTHQLTLSSRSGRNESDLLSESDTLIEFAARYLNALRLPQAALGRWVEQGAVAEELPNACAACSFRSQCHDAFSFATLSGRDHAEQPAVAGDVGLYPFNPKALTTLYSYLRDDIGKTPRTFLNDILAYVLDSHGDKIPIGEFPPPATVLAAGVGQPSFDPPAHERIVENQSGAGRERLRSLLLFWGERNAFNGQQDGVSLVGGLPQPVYDAFKLPMIEGTPRHGDVQPPQSTLTKETKPDAGTDSPSKAQGPAAAAGKYSDRIDPWVNGDKLYAFDRFADWIASLFDGYIDWQAHGISRSQVRDYLQGSRITIEGQSGRPVPGRHTLELTRSDPLLPWVLRALADLNDGDFAVTPQLYGEHVATLSEWLALQEPRVVDFVREPGGTIVAPETLVRMLLEECTLLAALGGELTASAADLPEELFRQVIASCSQSTEARWREQTNAIAGNLPKLWQEVIRQRGDSERVHRCRTGVLQLLNCPQGGSESVRFLNAADAIRILRDFTQNQWQLTPLPSQPDNNDSLWIDALSLHDRLSRKTDAVWRQSQAALAESRDKILHLLGADEIADTFHTIQETLVELRRVRQFSSELDAPFRSDGVQALGAARLEICLSQVREQLMRTDVPAQAAMLSRNFVEWNPVLIAHLKWLVAYTGAVQDNQTVLSGQIGALRAGSEVEAHYLAALQAYDAILARIDTVLAEQADARSARREAND